MFHGDHVTYLLFQLVCQRIGHHGLPRTGKPVKQHHHACSNMRPMGQAIDKRSNGTAIGHSTDLTCAVCDCVVHFQSLAAALERLKVADRIDNELLLLLAENHLLSVKEKCHLSCGL